MATRVNPKSKIGRRIASAAKDDSLDLGVLPGGIAGKAGRFAKSLAKQAKGKSIEKSKEFFSTKFERIKAARKKRRAAVDRIKKASEDFKAAKKVTTQTRQRRFTK